MYTVSSAIGVRKGLNKRWETVDPTAFTMAQLYATFRRVQLRLFVNGGLTPYYLDLATIAATYQDYTGTVAQMLTANGDATLPTTPTGLVLNSQKAEYNDAYRAGYKTTPVSTHNVPTSTASVGSAPNLRLTNVIKAIDYGYFIKRCLVNVCGFYHRIDTDGVNGVMVVDGMKTIVHGGENQIGLLSFANVCEIQQVPIVADMVDTSVESKATITLSTDTSGYQVLLMLAGYMIPVDDEALIQVSGFSYTIDFTKVNLVDKYYEAGQYLDLTNLDLVVGTTNSDQVEIADLTTPEAILNWLMLSQSFIIILKHDELYREEVAVRQTHLPSRYIAYAEPFALLALETGRHPPYWKVKDNQWWSIRIYDSTISNRLFVESPEPEWPTNAGNENSGYSGKISQASLIEIGRDV